MNDKSYQVSKIERNLEKLLGIRDLSGHELIRLKTLSEMVSSILGTGRSELIQIARGQSPKTKLSSRIKKIKRWILNKKTSYEKHYKPYALELLNRLSEQGELVFSIDGSTMGRGCMCLMFSVIYKGKALPAIWKVYKSKKGHLKEICHQSLLKELSLIIPKNCRVIIVGDGEFDGCNFQEDIKKLDWFYVLRTGKNIEIEEENGEFFKLKTIDVDRFGTLFFEEVRFTKKRYAPVNILIWHDKKHESPLYLVTNLDAVMEIKSFYKKRFKIEPFFRDQKSKGFHIHRSGLGCPLRISKLLIATCLAYIICVMAGVKASKSKFYSLVAREDGDFLSLFQLGLRFIELLVDLRQWRAFSWTRDFPLVKEDLYYEQKCVPF
jgi:hypothetical protein